MSLSHQSPVSLRDAFSKDASEIAELGAYVFTVTFGHSVQPHELHAFLSESYTTSAILVDITDPSKDLIVAINTENDKIIGFALLTRGSTQPCLEHLDMTIELQRVYLHPDFHGKGVGKLLANKLEQMARDQGFKYIWLGVWGEHRVGIKAYTKWGYVKVGQRDFTIGDVVQADDIMIKIL